MFLQDGMISGITTLSNLVLVCHLPQLVFILHSYEKISTPSNLKKLYVVHYF
jgi:hypothetical protein